MKLLGKDLPSYEREFKFHPGRKFSIDFAWPSEKIAVETEGGVWVMGRHNRGSGFVKDVEKYNLLALFGFRLYRVIPDMLTNDPVQVVEDIRQLLHYPLSTDG